MKCPKCQTNNSDSAKFCGVCGQALVVKTDLHPMSTTQPGGFKFCEECGQPLNSPQPLSTPSPTSAPPPPPRLLRQRPVSGQEVPGGGGQEEGLPGP